MKHYGCLLMLLSFCLPAVAGEPPPICDMVEDDDASAPVQEHPPTARVLEQLRTDRTINVQAAAAQLVNAAGDDTLDDAVGHLRWVMRNNDGEPELMAYWVLDEMNVEGRADVADQFIAGLDDEQQAVRSASASGLINAPSSRRKRAGFALLDRLEKEGDESVYNELLNALAQVASPVHKSRVGTLRVVLTRDQPSDVRVGLVVDWKTEAASALINILGPEEAIPLFRALDASKTGERLGIEGALLALTMFGMGQFEEGESVIEGGAGFMDAARRDKLRDSFREYGIGLLSQGGREEAERDARVRTAALQLFGVVLGPSRRQTDIDQIRAALQVAVAMEREGSPVADQINEVLVFLESL